MTSESKERLDDLRVIGLLVLLLTGVYFDVLLLGNNLFTRDLTIYHYPMKMIVRDTMLDGDFPFWNRFSAAGQPMAANPAYEVFYPPQWLVFLPDYKFGFQLHIILHAYIAAIGAYLFLRSLRVRRGIAFIGGVAFVLSGPFSSVFNLLPFMFSVTWTPWIALFASRYFERKRRRDFAATALFLGIQALICEPTTLLQTWFVLGVWGAFSGWKGARPLLAAARGFMTSVLVVWVGLFIAAIQFLPGLDHATDSVRMRGLQWETVSQWSFPPLRFLEFLFPNLLGSAEAGGAIYWGDFLYARGGGPYLYSVYVGLVFGALTLAGLLARRRGSSFVAVVFTVSALMAIGWHSPLLRLLYDVGLLPSIRYPEKFILTAAFVGIAWGCVVLEDILRGDERLKRISFALMGTTALVAIGFFVWGLTPGFAGWFTSVWPQTHAALARISTTYWLIAAGRALAFIGGIALVLSRKSRAAMALLAMLVLADLAPLGNQINPRMPSRYFDVPPILEQFSEPRDTYRNVHLASLQMNSETWKRYIGNHDTYWSLRNGLFPGLNSGWGIPSMLEFDVDETQLLHTREFVDLVSDMLAAGQTDWPGVIGPMINLGTILLFRDPDQELSRIGGNWEDVDPVELVTLPGWPRYYLAGEVVPISDSTELLNRLLNRRWPSNVAFIYGPAGPASPGLVTSIEETPNNIRLVVDAEGPATLVASVTAHRYWSATIDGDPVSIDRINHAFQGIRVPEGRHTIEFTYFNPVIPAGAAISLTMLVGLGIWSRQKVRHG